MVCGWGCGGADACGLVHESMKGDGGSIPFISLFMITPVSGTITVDPKKRLMVVVKVMANPDASAVTM